MTDQPGPSREEFVAPQAPPRPVEQQEVQGAKFDFGSTTYLDGQFFRFDPARSTDQHVVGICQICPDKKAIRGRRYSSSNFNTHLKRQHPVEYEGEYLVYAATKKLRLTSEALLQEGKSASCRFSQPLFEKNVAEFILHSMVPFSTVEMPSFRKIFDDLHIVLNGVPLKHISRRQLVRSLNVVHEREMAEVRQALASAEYVCTTADVWSSNNRRFLGVTVHWIDPLDYKRRSAAIACRRFPGSHTSDRIASLLDGIHDEYQLKGKLVATITDNASNFAKAFRDFGIDEDALLPYEPVITETGDDELSDAGSDAGSDAESTASADAPMAELDEEDEEIAFSQPDPWDIIGNVIPDSSTPDLPRHLRCMSHTLNLIATTDFSELMNNDFALKRQHDITIARCTNLWKMLRSPKQRETLFGILGRSLMRPVVVRWNSLFNSFNQIIQLKQKIVEASAAMNLSDSLQETDFKYIEEYLHCLKPIADAIIKLQGQNFSYYGSVLPTIVSLRRLIAQAGRTRSLTICEQLPRHMQVCIEKRFDEYLAASGNGLFGAVSAVLNPRFKRIWMPSLQTEVKASIDNAVKAAINSFSELGPPRVLEENILDDEFFNFGTEDTSSTSSTPSNTMPVSEIELLKYLAERPNNNISVLNNYPALKKPFLYYNTPLPSSAAVERLFSYATMTSVPKYNRLTDEQFEKRVLAKCNAAINKK